MRLTTLLLLTAALLVLSACEPRAQRKVVSDQDALKPNTQAENVPGMVEARSAQLKTNAENQSFAKSPTQATQAKVSLTQADAANAASQAIERKIIRNANLTLEVASPTESQRKIFSAAETHGGFVVTSEMTQQTSDDKSKPEVSVNLVVRVPACSSIRLWKRFAASPTASCKRNEPGKTSPKSSSIWKPASRTRRRWKSSFSKS